MYRDSKLGLCIDLTGPDGNVFVLMALGDNIAKQTNCYNEWKDALTAVRLMGGEYLTIIHLFEEFFPVVTLIGKEEIYAIHKEDGEGD